jgi:hypothetical protein
VTNAGQVQLTPAQMEEAKQITYSKMKQYRRDRLFANDSLRIDNLASTLKKNRNNNDD